MERKINISLVIATLAIVLAIGVAVSGGKTIIQEVQQLGGDTNYDSVDVTDGYKVDGTEVISGTGDITVTGGTLNVSTTNTATSTAIAGCVQTYATSTATAIKLIIGSVATSSATFGDGTTVGLVGWRYGTCPNL